LREVLGRLKKRKAWTLFRNPLRTVGKLGKALRFEPPRGPLKVPPLNPHKRGPWEWDGLGSIC